MNFNSEYWESVIRALLGIVITVPTVAVLVQLSFNGDTWAAYTLVGLTTGVLAFYGFQIKDLVKNIRERIANKSKGDNK